MSIHTLAADICDRIPEMARDCKINNQKVIETMIREYLDSMKPLEKKMFMPDCDNPSGLWPHQKHYCSDCGEKTATEINGVGMHICAKCRCDKTPEQKP
jgi:hypothetical protein